MRKRDQASLDAASLDELVEEITVDANGEDEQLWAFRQAFEDNVSVPCEATVIGEPVKVMKFDYDGNNRRGLTAMCRRADGTNYVVAASDLVIPLSASGGRYLAAYRKWMGLAPLPRGTRGRTVQQTAVAPPDLDGPIELVVLSVKQKSARCRLLGGDRTFTFRAGRLWDLVPGEIAVIRPAKQWIYAGNPYLSGVIESTRLDARALRLVALRLEERGLWDPMLSARGIYDVCLTLTMDGSVVGNDVAGDQKALVMITGANRGGKSTLLRSLGLAQLMMQCGMFVPAESFVPMSPAASLRTSRGKRTPP
jgi:hypothetical protein